MIHIPHRTTLVVNSVHPRCPVGSLNRFGISRALELDRQLIRNTALSRRGASRRAVSPPSPRAVAPSRIIRGVCRRGRLAASMERGAAARVASRSPRSAHRRGALVNLAPDHDARLAASLVSSRCSPPGARLRRRPELRGQGSCYNPRGMSPLARLFAKCCSIINKTRCRTLTATTDELDSPTVRSCCLTYLDRLQRLSR